MAREGLGGPRLLSSAVAGTGYENRVDACRDLHTGDELVASREPDNEYDPNAVRLDAPSGTDVGYVPRSVAGVLAEAIDAGWTIHVIVSEDSTWNELIASYDVPVFIFTYPEEREADYEPVVSSCASRLKGDGNPDGLSVRGYCADELGRITEDGVHIHFTSKKCCLFSHRSPIAASGQAETLEHVKDYGSVYRDPDGTIRHRLHTWDEGERCLRRCPECGALFLVQFSEYHGLEDDDYYTDWFQVDDEATAELINATWDGFALEFRYDGLSLLKTNGRYAYRNND